MGNGWNFGDVWEAAADDVPTSIALVHGDRRVMWADFERRANGLAARFVAEGLDRLDRVALLMRNRPEYLETTFATFKSSTAPVNTNYRYGVNELIYLWDNADAMAIVFADEFVEACEVARQQLPGVRLWVHVGPPERCPTWAVPYEDITAVDSPRVRAHQRSGDDIIMQYTGGTTGMPKGVMWRHDDLFRMLEAANGSKLAGVSSPVEFVQTVRGRGVRVMPAAPLMHGTAAWFAMPALSRGGSIITLTSRSFDAIELLDTLVERRVSSVALVGDVFVKPMLAALDDAPQRWDLSHVRVVFSSGVMFSRESKQRLMAYAPNALIVDNLGSQESGATGLSTSSKGNLTDTAQFTPAPGTQVIAEDGTVVVPGSGVRGRIAITGFLPLGYHKDPEKTAQTFVLIEGERYVVPGDWAEVLADGSMRLLGRGSQCINTGGEKVYPEEVEEVLKALDGIRDAAVVGVPSERYGEQVIAIIESDPALSPSDEQLDRAARVHLAGYKMPKRILRVDTLQRGANGKLDYPALRAYALDELGLGSNA